MKEAGTRWWHGRRGEWYVVLQALLFLLVLCGPRTCSRCPPWSTQYAAIGTWAGLALLLSGSLLAAAGAIQLGSNLTPFPRPKEHGILITTGVYRLVRHPIYSGIIFMAFGWSLWVHSWLTTGYAVLLFAFLDVKSRREELWLSEKFPTYSTYRMQVRKLIPFVY